MAKTSSNIDLYKSLNNNQQTPPKLINTLLKGLNIKEFDMDVCCEQNNIPAKINIRENGQYKGRELINKFDFFSSELSGICFMNPPFDKADKFCKRINHQIEKNKDLKVIGLLPVRTETVYWHDEIFEKADFIYFFKRKFNFYRNGELIAGSGNPSPICLVFWNFNKSEVKKFKLKNFMEGTFR